MSWAGGEVSYGRGAVIGVDKIGSYSTGNITARFIGVSTAFGSKGFFKLPFANAPLYAGNPWSTPAGALLSDVRKHWYAATGDEVRIAFNEKKHGSNAVRRRAARPQRRCGS